MKNSQRLEIPSVDCIGRISPTDLLELQGIPLSVDRAWEVSLSIFDNKKIMDFWAGISNFLNYISRLSSPKSLTAVDIMYKTSEIYDATVLQTRENTQKKARNYISWIRKEKIEDREEELTIYYLNIFKRIQSIISQEHHHIKGIRKISELENIESEMWTFDYIYATHVLFYFDNRELLLNILLHFLSPEGKLIITDYHPTREHGWAAMRYLQELTEQWVTGITPLWMHEESGDICVQIEKKVS
jgi:SAM-dependent methyltransferase